MPSNDNEIPVEPTEPEWLDERAELRLQGSRRALLIVIGLLAVGKDTVPNLRRPVSNGDTERLMALVGQNVVDELNEKMFGDLVDGPVTESKIRARIDPSGCVAIRDEDVPDLVDVGVVVVGDE